MILIIFSYVSGKPFVDDDVRNIPCRRKWGEHYDNDLKSFIAEINYLTTRK
jgi:hypothetical protein